MEIVLAKEALEAIETMLRGISDQQVKRFNSNELTPMEKGEEPIGALHNPSTQRLFVLGHVMLLRARELHTRAMLAETDEERDRLVVEGQRLDGLEEVVSELKWVQAREDVGDWSLQIGIREDWMIVRRPNKKGKLKASKGGVIASGAIDVSDLPDELRKLLGIDD